MSLVDYAAAARKRVPGWHASLLFQHVMLKI